MGMAMCMACCAVFGFGFRPVNCEDPMGRTGDQGGGPLADF
jgi:hypothetical protein